MNTVAIVDDSPEDARALADVLVTCTDSEILVYENAQSLEGALAGGVVPDVVFIDICLDGANGKPTGIAVVERLERRGFTGSVVYISGFDTYHTSVYRTRHAGYLRKPFSHTDVAETWHRLMEDAEHKRERPLCVRVAGEERIVNPSDIWYIESDLRRVRVHLRLCELETYGKLGDMLSRLPAQFVRCHQSFAVNLRYVEHLGATDIELVDGRSIPVSRRRRQQVRDALFAYIKDGRRRDGVAGASVTERGA